MIVCDVNNKVYIGQTRNNFGDRRDSHIAKLRGGYHDNKELQDDWNKFGEKHFKFEIIEDLTGKSQDYLYDIEKETILLYKSKGLCYNITNGKGLLGCVMSEETKRKIGEKNRINMTGKKASDETRLKMSISQRRRYELMSPEERREAYGKSSKVS